MVDRIAESIYEQYMMKVRDPPTEKTKWQIPNGNRLGIVILEFREQKFIEQV